MASGEGVNSAMLASIYSHVHSFSGKNIPITGEGFGVIIGGDTFAAFAVEGMDVIFKLSDGIAVAFAGNIDDLRKLAGSSSDPFKIQGASFTNIDGSVKISLHHLSPQEQANAKIQFLTSKTGEQSQSH